MYHFDIVFFLKGVLLSLDVTSFTVFTPDMKKINKVLLYRSDICEMYLMSLI